MNEPKLVVTGRKLTVSESTRWRNPNLYPAGGVVSGGLASAKREPNSVPALEQREVAERRRKKRVVVCIEILALKRRILDDDNICAGAKQLRDCIATSLGVDDGDKRLRWHYACCQTSGREQTIVRISLK